MCAHNGQLGVALTLGAAVPSHSALQRWFGEPVRAIVVPTSVFQTNKRGFPALPKAHQAVLVSFFQLNVQVNSAAMQLHGCMVLHACQIGYPHLAMTHAMKPKTRGSAPLGSLLGLPSLQSHERWEHGTPGHQLHMHQQAK